jgi:lysophospholipase L1-like esterase
MNVLIFGDSITHGQYDSRGGWANRLIADQFAKKGQNPGEDIDYIYNLGIGGNTTRMVINRMMSEVTARKWSPETEFAFVFAIGINDTMQYRDAEPISSPQKYAEEIRHLLGMAQEITDKILFVGMTPVEDQNFEYEIYRSERVGEFEAVMRTFTKEQQIPHVPLFEIFQAGMSIGRELFTDGLHPNDDGHELIYQEVKPALEALLSRDR